jgi:hypothetical protein
MSSKGGTGERWLARKLTKWITGQEDPPIFWRSGGSGSVATVALKANRKAKAVGDIVATDSEGFFLTDRFGIENKFGYGFKLDDLLFHKPFRANQKAIAENHILNWWRKIKEQSHQVGLTPLLVFRKNQYPAYIMYDETTWSFITTMYHRILNIQGDDLGGNPVFVSVFDTWLDTMQPQDIKECWRVKTRPQITLYENHPSC